MAAEVQVAAAAEATEEEMAADAAEAKIAAKAEATEEAEAAQ